jgi:hypothetical protein
MHLPQRHVGVCQTATLRQDNYFNNMLVIMRFCGIMLICGVIIRAESWDFSSDPFHQLIEWLLANTKYSTCILLAFFTLLQAAKQTHKASLYAQHLAFGHLAQILWICYFVGSKEPGFNTVKTAFAERRVLYIIIANLTANIFTMLLCCGRIYGRVISLAHVHPLTLLLMIASTHNHRFGFIDLVPFFNNSYSSNMHNTNN